MVRSSRLVLPEPGELTMLNTNTPALTEARAVLRRQRVVLLEHLAFDRDHAHRPAPAATTVAVHARSRSRRPAPVPTPSALIPTRMARRRCRRRDTRPGRAVGESLSALAAGAHGRHPLDDQCGALAGACPPRWRRSRRPAIRPDTPAISPTRTCTARTSGACASVTYWRTMSSTLEAMPISCMAPPPVTPVSAAVHLPPHLGHGRRPPGRRGQSPSRGSPRSRR